MRHLIWLAFALFLVAPLGAPARAATPGPADLALTARPAIIDVAVKCGPRAHYIRGHRAKNREWIKGRCVRDKRRR